MLPSTRCPCEIVVRHQANSGMEKAKIICGKEYAVLERRWPRTPLNSIHLQAGCDCPRRLKVTQCDVSRRPLSSCVRNPCLMLRLIRPVALLGVAAIVAVAQPTTPPATVTSYATDRSAALPRRPRSPVASVRRGRLNCSYKMCPMSRQGEE
jgi:hypothetical protein